MRFVGFGGKLAVAGLVAMTAAPFGAGAANARSRTTGAVHANARVIYTGMAAAYSYGYTQHAYGYTSHAFGYAQPTRSFSHASYSGSSSYSGPSSYSGSSSYSGGHMQCVPFARENTGIELSGNAATWWAAAQGVYERGAKPEVGSVLNFRANGRMHMGHVAVVSNIVNARTVAIDHANWSGRGSISRDTTVVDVSPGNDWTAVRVSIGGDQFGSIYPTYGFIYDRPDRGIMVANNVATPAPVLNPAPRDLRPAVDRFTVTTAPQEAEEVAEAPDDSSGGVQPRFARFDRRMMRAQSRGPYLVRSFGPTGGHRFGPAAVRSFGPRPAQVFRVRAPAAYAPAPRATAHHHGRA